MMDYTIRDLQLSILEILIEIKRICEDNNIRYFLEGGTCLGAIRHNGFIPWDDDADIAMPRQDYEIFKNLCKNNHVLNELYTLQDYDPILEPHYGEGFIRIRKKNTLCVINYHKEAGYKDLGVFVDIFPYDFINYKTNKQIKKIYKKYNLISKLFKNKVALNHPTFKSKLFSFILCFTSKKYLYKKRESICKKFNEMNSNYIISLNSKYKMDKATFPSYIISTLIDHNFEGIAFKIPANYNTMLTIMYGDYMKLPPKELQVGHMPTEIKL